MKFRSNFCMYFRKKCFLINVSISIFVIIFLYWMSFISITTNTNNISFVYCHTTDMYVFIIRNICSLSRFR